MNCSIIIPTLNEEGYVADAIRFARLQKPHEIIVVDGGSADRTREHAGCADWFLISERGRAAQMNAGAAQAQGDTLLFLHADCRLEVGALTDAARLLQSTGVAACCFRQTVESGRWLYRLIDCCAGARVRLTGLAYGDQGLCVRRDVFQEIGGFPRVRLMEDVLICRRFGKHGRIAVANSRIFVSPRRWRNVGLLRQTLTNWGLTALTAAGLSPDTLARFYPAVR